MSLISGSMGAVMGADAQTESANTAANAQNNATAMQKQIYDEEVKRNKPFYDVGVNAIPDYLKMLNGGYDMKESPSAQYSLTQGTKTLNRQLASRGLLGSGNAAQRLSELSSGVAANDYSQQYSRMLDALKLGTGASASMGAASSTYGNSLESGAQNLGNIAMNSGAARASLYSGMGGASGSALGTGLNIYNSGVKNGWWGSGAGSVGASEAVGGSGAATADEWSAYMMG